jgi:hypothetical protein
VFNESLHPRSHGKFARASGSADVAAIRRGRRVPTVKSSPRSPLSAGLTDEHWRTSFEAHGVRGETLAQYKQRATASALKSGMTRDARGFFYKPDDVHRHRPLGASGFPVAVGQPRIEQHRASRPSAERGEMQDSAGMSKRVQKYRRARTGALQHMGYRTVGGHVGPRRAVQQRTARQVMSVGRHRA